MIRRLVVSATAIIAVSLGACDSSNDSDGGQDAAQADPDATVSVAEDEALGEILVDSSGAALYTAEQESGGAVLCQDGCAEVWVPLTVDSGEAPTASDEVTATLSTVDRGDGSTQVTLDGMPLYTFAMDGRPGDVTGDGLSDDFDGTAFTWHVARPDGTAEAPPPDNVGGY